MSSPSLAEQVLEELEGLYEDLLDPISESRPLTPLEAAEVLSAIKRLRVSALARRESSAYERARRGNGATGSVMLPTPRADG